MRALQGQRGDQRARPGGDPRQARRRLVGGGIEMPRAARQRVEQRRAIAGVAAGQDVGRIGGPEEDALAPQLGRPGLVDPRAMGDQPAPGDRLGQPRALFAAGRSGEVAQPGEALHFARQRAVRARARRNRCRPATTSSLPSSSRPASSASPRARSPSTWSRGTATSRSGCRPDPNRRERSEPLASRPTTSSLMRASFIARSAAILAA